MDDDPIRSAAFTWLKGQVDIHGEILNCWMPRISSLTMRNGGACYSKRIIDV